MPQSSTTPRRSEPALPSHQADRRSPQPVRPGESKPTATGMPQNNAVADHATPTLHVPPRRPAASDRERKPAAGRTISPSVRPLFDTRKFFIVAL